MKPGPKVKANSVNNNGRTSIAVDRFTRDALAQQAAKHHKTIGIYLRDMMKSHGELSATLPGLPMVESAVIAHREISERLTFIETLLQPLIGANAAPVTRHGMQLAMGDLTLQQRVATVFANYAGIKIDRRKLLDEIKSVIEDTTVIISDSES